MNNNFIIRAVGSIFFIMAAAVAEEPSYGISANPGATNVEVGTGELGTLLKVPSHAGVRLGGLWIGDYNVLVHGNEGSCGTGNSVLLLGLSVDLRKAVGWTGGSFGVELLQFNGQATNEDAGIVQGYNSLTGAPPFHRTELYQLWVRQEFLDNKLSLRIGKTIPTYHFNNVSKPVPTENPGVTIPSVSGLIYTPIFVNTTMLGVIGGYYNSVYGVTATVAPSKQAYLNLGVYDGNLARGVQTGLTGPHFNGYYFSIAEVGYGWATAKPGIAAIGGWYQSGLLASGSQQEKGTEGVYAFGSQALWTAKSSLEDKGNISGFLQLGWNHSKTLAMNRFLGLGATAFALISSRPADSFGVGLAWSRLNRALFVRKSEWMFQGYYQASLYKSIYFQPAISYVPRPGAHPDRTNVVAITGRVIALF